MSLSAVCDAIGSITADTTHTLLTELAKQCESFLGSVNEVMDTVENALTISAGGQRLMLWFFVDRLAKQHANFLDSFRLKIIPLASRYGFGPSDPEWADFTTLLKSSFTVLFGAALVSLILMQLGGTAAAAGTSETGVPESAAMRASNAAAAAAAAATTALSGGRSSSALTIHSAALRRAGAFVTKAVAVERGGNAKHALQVKTLDSQMAMTVASSYAPARPVEVQVAELRPDADAPRGYMQAMPTGYAKAYEQTRRKRLRDIMSKNREDQDRRQQAELHRRMRGDSDLDGTDDAEAAAPDSSANIGNGEQESPGTKEDGRADSGGKRSSKAQYDAYTDIVMPVEFPRDEFGVRRGNFPLGVRFIKNAVAACGGAVEFDVLVNRLASLASREAVAEFGNIREFLLIHSPTFKLELEKGQWIVRLVSAADANGGNAAAATAGGSSSVEESTWESMTCPHCSRVVKGRNFAKHENCRRCISAQMAFGLHGDVSGRGPIAELAFLAKELIARRTTYDDGDVDLFADALRRSAEVRRFRLASPRTFAPVLKALRIVRDRWLEEKGVVEMDDAAITAADGAIANLLRIFGENVHRLPIAWIEMGDVIDMCHRFTKSVKPPFNPPPRPADPRISLENEYPGFLLCESEVDSEDDPSDGEEEFSDDEAPAFTFAPPVDVAESIFTAGFDRDTKRLQHRMRTAPPLVLQRVLRTDGAQTHREAYTNFQNSGRR